MINFINALLGGALLIAGRKLFWLFVGTLGFVTGMQLAAGFQQGPEGLGILIGFAVGVIFALLAIFLQTIAIGIAGFFAGGYVLSVLTGMLGLNGGALGWVIYIVGGVIGIVLVSYLFDWAIITLSSLAGASLVIEGFGPGRGVSALIFTILFFIGVIIQGTNLRNEKNQQQREA